MKKVILGDYLSGLQVIISEIENERIPNTINVQGASYFFSKRTAERFGFRVEDATSFEKLNVLVNYLDLTWMYSLAHDKLLFPKLSQMKVAKITGEGLVEKKEILEQYFNRLNQATHDQSIS